MNRPASRFHRSMHHLALIAMVLMLCMPVLSRWQQHVRNAVWADADDAGMCLSDASRAALDVDEQGADIRVRDYGHQAGGGSPLHDQHLDHGAACGYCTLATRLLPVLALALAVPLPLPVRHSSVRVLPAAPATPLWPAHHPRGPPPIS